MMTIKFNVKSIAHDGTTYLSQKDLLVALCGLKEDYKTADNPEWEGYSIANSTIDLIIKALVTMKEI